MTMKHAEFHYLDPAAIARDFPPREPLADYPGVTRATIWEGIELTPEMAFTLARAGNGRGPRMFRLELTCWAADLRKRHTLGQIVAAADGQIEIDPRYTAGQPGCLAIGDRLAIACHPCRRSGRILKETLYLPDLIGCIAWMATLRDEDSGDLLGRVEFRRPAHRDEIQSLTHYLTRAAGREDRRQRQARVALRARLIRAVTACHST